MRNSLFEPEHQDFREGFRNFLRKEILPNALAWDEAGVVPREAFALAGARGFLAMQAPEEFGGAGVDDFRFNMVVGEEVQLLGVPSFGAGVTLHNDICAPYFLEHGTPEQRERWLPGIVSGELITAIALTEPDAGSDLAGIRTRAVLDGDHYVVSGAKTFITNGLNSDVVITAVTTDPALRHRGILLLVIERGMRGFTRGRNLEKLGLHGQDTAELFFDEVRVPVANRLGEEGEGFRILARNLAQERLSIAIAGVAASEAALAWTVDHVRGRRAFGRGLGALQSVRFTLAEMRTEIDVARSFLHDCVRALALGELTSEDAAMAKWWCTELQGRVVDRCVQLHGGYGYMLEYPIARAYADARVTRIYGGANEVMKEIIGRSMGVS